MEVKEEVVSHDFVEFKDQLITVGRKSIVMSSTDLSAWNSTQIGLPDALNAASSCKGSTVLVGKNGSVITLQGILEDAISLVQQQVGLGSFNDVFCDGQYWTAVGYNRSSEDAGIITSTNGISWKTHEVSGYYYNKVFARNGSWKAAGVNGIVASWSSGASNWGTEEIYEYNYLDLNDIYANDEYWITIGPVLDVAGIFTLFNGESEWSYWQCGYVSRSISYDSVHIDSDSGSIVAVGSAGIAYSTNGSYWEEIPIEYGSYYRGIYSHAGKWIAVGANQKGGLVSISVDGTSWSSQQIGQSKINKVLAEQGLWVTVGNDGQITSSLDGVNWIIHKSTINKYDYQDIVYDTVNHQWIAVGQSGQVFSAVEPAH